jgi:hypothetical protein
VNERNASVADVANAVRESGADDSFVRPGKWQSKVTIEAFEVPGMPPEMAKRMKDTMAQYQERSFETCLTKEEAKRPKEDFFTGKREGCRYDHFKMGSGKIDAVMRCAGDGGASQVMQMAGHYAPETYDMRMSMKQEGGQSPAAGMNMTMKVDAKRVGECDSKKG